MFRLLKRFLSKPISHDEKIVFERIASNLPAELRRRLLLQVSAISKSAPNQEGDALCYDVDVLRLGNGDVDYLLSDAPGILDFARIDLRLYEQTQPFTLELKDGIVYCLKLSPPMQEESGLKEFDVVRFSLL